MKVKKQIENLDNFNENEAILKMKKKLRKTIHDRKKENGFSQQENLF